MADAFSAARDFVLTHGRLLEQRMFLALFGRDGVDGVVDALCGYQNADGGFGHGLEPDVLCPASLPLDIDFAFAALVAVGAREDALDPTRADRLRAAVDYLAAVAPPDRGGPAVSLASPVIESHPRAAHWAEWAYAPALNPTAGLAGALHALGIAHPWRDAADAWCWAEIDRLGVPPDPHTLLAVLTFLAHAPDGARADAVGDRIAEGIDSIPGVLLDPAAEGYGLTAVQFAPTADARWRRLFTPAQIDAALDHLAASQQGDGGWPVTWDPPGPASLLAWRAHVTVLAVRTLASYGRITVPPG